MHDNETRRRLRSMQPSENDIILVYIKKLPISKAGLDIRMENFELRVVNLSDWT